MQLKIIAVVASTAAVLGLASPALAAAPATMTFQIDVTGAVGSSTLPATTSFQETFTLQGGVLSTSGFGPIVSTELSGGLSGSDGLTADLKALVDLSSATDYSNWSMGTFAAPGTQNTEGDLYENIFAPGVGGYQQSIDGGSLSGYLPASQSAKALAAFFQQVQPMAWYEQVTGSDYQVLAGYTGTASLLSITGGGAPEPAAWALMLLGFGGLGAALRRRRSALAA